MGKNPARISGEIPEKKWNSEGVPEETLELLWEIIAKISIPGFLGEYQKNILDIP